MADHRLTYSSAAGMQPQVVLHNPDCKWGCGYLSFDKRCLRAHQSQCDARPPPAQSRPVPGQPDKPAKVAVNDEIELFFGEAGSAGAAGWYAGRIVKVLKRLAPEPTVNIRWADGSGTWKRVDLSEYDWRPKQQAGGRPTPGADTPRTPAPAAKRPAVKKPAVTTSAAPPQHYERWEFPDDSDMYDLYSDDCSEDEPGGRRAAKGVHRAKRRANKEDQEESPKKRPAVSRPNKATNGPAPAQTGLKPGNRSANLELLLDQARKQEDFLKKKLDSQQTRAEEAEQRESALVWQLNQRPDASSEVEEATPRPQEASKSLKRELQDLTKKLAREQSSVAMLRNKTVELRQEISKNEAVISQLREKNVKLEKDRHSCRWEKRQIEALKEENEALKSGPPYTGFKSKLMATCKGLRQENATLRQENVQLKNDGRGLRERMMQDQSTDASVNDKFVTRVKETMTKLVTRIGSEIQLTRPDDPSNLAGGLEFNQDWQWIEEKKKKRKELLMFFHPDKWARVRELGWIAEEVIKVIPDEI